MIDKYYKCNHLSNRYYSYSLNIPKLFDPLPVLLRSRLSEPPEEQITSAI